jgi:hypothetical protein
LTAGLLVSELQKSPLSLIYGGGAKGAMAHGESLKHLTFNQSPVKENDTDMNSLSVRVSTWLSRKGMAISQLPYFEITELGYSPTVYKLKQDVTLIGYFQSYRYLEDLCVIKKESFNVQPRVFSKTLYQYLNEIESSNPIALHVRRGDYVGNSSTGLLSRAYYANSLELMASKGRDVWVFSDNIQDAREMLRGVSNPKWKWIDSLNLQSSSQTLYAMSMCPDIIIANSTFSWWAASLNKASNVIAPRKWFANQADPIDLISPEWMRVTSSWS